MKYGGYPRNSSTSLQTDAPGEREKRWSNQGRGRGNLKSHVKDDVRAGHREDDTVPRGTCQTMCPTVEMHKRESQRRLHRFEMLVGTEKDRRPRADPRRIVKEYSRPAAGKDSAGPADLRPPTVLLKTVCYLIDEVAAAPQLHPWTEVYSFVFDRLRSVKQDMIIQRANGPDCVAILERTVRFLIYASYRLCGEPLRLFDPRINDTHLQENLNWLLECYANGNGPHPNQEEFQALCLLYNLGSHRAMQHIMELPAPLRHSPTLTLAISINRSFLERNPVRLLRLAHRLNFLQACALHRHMTASRKDLLLIYSHGYSSRNCRFPLDALSKLLALEESLTSTLCQVCGVEVNTDQQVVFSKGAFAEPEQGKLCCSFYHNIVSEKQKVLALSNLLHGCI
ncbi:SAC3 domain-containing protein 1 isoform X2 [Corythoichthys intestinalis]|uniref:SAC3 domain-containing protein 1 isoform X2 n=1 Tax=Corythoichthys intestinalis TaxID=161448 RepID=UPI0025A52178|nr:SAC3 domain-containing protein 1 isoform X2 [Corythoichthys intestinalis]